MTYSDRKRRYRVLSVLESPSKLHGTELCAHASALALAEAGHVSFLLHADGDEFQHSAYAAGLAIPELFKPIRSYMLSRPALLKQRVRAFCEEHAIDVVHCHSRISAKALRQLKRIRPTVCTVHVPMCPNGSRFAWRTQSTCKLKPGFRCVSSGYARMGCGHLGNGRAVRLDQFIRMWLEDSRYRRVASTCDALIAISHYMKSRLSADGLPSEKIHLVPNPAYPATVSKDARSGDQRGKPAVLFVGRLQKFKGVHQLLDAAKLIKIPHKLWIVGTGSEFESLSLRCKTESGLGGVELLGEKTPDEVQRKIARARVVVFPSIWDEPFGLVGVEAGALGKPVVAFDVGGVPDWLSDGENGFVVPYKDVDALAAKIEVLLADDDLAQKQGRRGRELALRWTRTEHAHRLSSVFSVAVLNSKDRFS